MRLNLPTPDDLPTVSAALSWLLPPGVGSDAMSDACQSLLIVEAPGEGWKVDGDMLARLVEAAWARLSDDDNEIGAVLHGLGELNARCHARLFGPVCAALRSRSGVIRLDRVLAAAIEREVLPRDATNLEAIAIAQWLTRAEANWGTFAQALAHLEHGGWIATGHRFGLEFVARVVLALDVRAVDACIQAYPDKLQLAAIGKAAVASARPFDGGRAGTILLRSKKPALRLLGAAALVCPFEDFSPPLDFASCRAVLIEEGVAPGEAVWLMGMRVKRACHTRNRLQHRETETVNRINYLERRPEAAFGGAQNAEAELDMSRRNLATSRDRAVKVIAELEDMLIIWAADWPAGGLSDTQMDWVDQGLATDPDLRHRLAAALPHRGNREWLSKGNVAALRSSIGLADDPARVPVEHLDLDERTFLNLAHGTAASLLLLYGDDVRAAAKRTSSLVMGVTRAALCLLQRPHAAARTPERWQSVVMRAVFACRFALVVAEMVPEAKRADAAKLNELAMDCARKVLPSGDLVHNAGEAFLRLASEAVHGMARCRDPEPVREQWALDERLLVFPRALALWSSPSLVTKHLDLARNLFLLTGDLPLSQQDYNGRFTELLCLLDAAIAFSAVGDRTDLVDEAVRLWPVAYRAWNDVAPTWGDTAVRLADAMAGEGSARDALVADPSFASSYCRQFLRQFSDRL